MKTNTHKLVMASLFAAIICVVTMIIKVPSPFKGYLNLGDCIVLFAGWTLSPFYGFFAAAIGSALADVLSGYAVYAPATFVIKGVMALTAGLLCRKKKLKLLGGILAEVIMILGYFAFEGVLYGFAPSVVNIPANAVQGALNLVLGLVIVRVFNRGRNVI